MYFHLLDNCTHSYSTWRVVGLLSSQSSHANPAPVLAVLVCAAASREDHLVWVGFVESKIRHLIGNLERNPAVVLSHVNPKQYVPIKPFQFVLGRPLT